jgi:heat shock protein HslJ
MLSRRAKLWFWTVACALVFATAPSRVASQASSAQMAPADQYFGRMKLSYLTINSTFEDVANQVGRFTTDPRIANKIDFAMEALNEWQNLYPRDPQLARSYFLGQLTLKKIWIKQYQDKAWAYMQYLVKNYPTTYFGKTVKAALAGGFTQHYFADPVACGAATPAPAAPVDYGKYKVTVYASPCTPPTPQPTAVTSPQPPAGGPTLESGPWTLVELGGKPVVVPADEATPTLHFDAGEKRVSGSTGCNNLMGTYTVDGSALHFSPLATTMMACLGPGVQARETAFLAALGKVTAYRIEGALLHLYAGDAPLATLRSSPGK